MEENIIIDDTVEEVNTVAVKIENEPKVTKKVKVERLKNNIDMVSPLRNEKVNVKFIPKDGIYGNNPRHVLSGGMLEDATVTFVVPRLTSGMYVNVLTDSEKAFLEEYMGLEYNALSIYKKNDNFWSDANPEGINRVILNKRDNYLNLADPIDYIKYKILLANKDYVAPSLKAYQDMPKATYKYIIVATEEQNKKIKDTVSNTSKCFKHYGKIEDDYYKLKFIVETLTNKPIAVKTKIDFIQNEIIKLINSDAKLFLSTVEDKYLDTKIIIKRCVEENIISNRNGFYYLRSDNTPLCEKNEDPTLNTAARYLNNPKHQDILLLLQAKLNQ